MSIDLALQRGGGGDCSGIIGAAPIKVECMGPMASIALIDEKST